MIASILGKKHNLGEVDSRSFSISELVRKLKEVCGIKIGCVEEIKVYVTLPRGNKVSEVTNCAKLVGIIALFNELGGDKLCLKVDYTVIIHESGEEKFSFYAKSKDVDHMIKVTCEGTTLKSARDDHCIDVQDRDKDEGDGNNFEEFYYIDLGENKRHTNIGS